MLTENSPIIKVLARRWCYVSKIVLNIRPSCVRAWSTKIIAYRYEYAASKPALGTIADAPSIDLLRSYPSAFNVRFREVQPIRQRTKQNASRLLETIRRCHRQLDTARYDRARNKTLFYQIASGSVAYLKNVSNKSNRTTTKTTSKAVMLAVAWPTTIVSNRPRRLFFKMARTRSFPLAISMQRVDA